MKKRYQVQAADGKEAFRTQPPTAASFNGVLNNTDHNALQAIGLGFDPSNKMRKPPNSRERRFWGVLLALCLATLLVAVEVTIPTASLPQISAELEAGDDWVWIVNGYLLTEASGLGGME